MEFASIRPSFESEVHLTVGQAFLSTAGPLLVDPMVRVVVMTESGAKVVVGKTSSKIFSGSPRWNESMTFSEPNMTKVLLEVVDCTTKAFLGTAECPFSPTHYSTGVSKQLMLLPENCLSANLTGREGSEDLSHNVQHKQDVARLQASQVDDFGFITISWSVNLKPNGGICQLKATAPTVEYPKSVFLKSQWLTSAHVGTVGVTHLTYIDAGHGKVALPQNGVMLNISAKEKASVHVTLLRKDVTSVQAKEVGFVDVELDFPLNGGKTPTYWCYPVFPPVNEEWSGADTGVLLVSLSTTAPEDAPSNPQDQNFVAWVTERKWRRSCVMDCKASEYHIRHLFDVVFQQAPLDPSMNVLISAFYGNRPLSSCDLRELIISMVFAGSNISIISACRFAFACARRTAEKAISVSDVAFVFEHCLVPRTLEMTKEQIGEHVIAIFQCDAPSETFVTFEQFVEFFAGNCGLWTALGIPLESSSPSESTATQGAPGLIGGAQDKLMAAPTDDVWRQFTVRVIRTGRAFAVTAHIEDTIERVKHMIEESTQMNPSRQRFTFDGQLLDNSCYVGEVMLPELIAANYEVSVTEIDEMLNLVLVDRAHHRKWECKFVAHEKVLKVRGFVQQKTMMPLTRIILTYAGQTMWDRHNLEHYKLVNGGVIEISTEQQF